MGHTAAPSLFGKTMGAPLTTVWAPMTAKELRLVLAVVLLAVAALPLGGCGSEDPTAPPDVQTTLSSAPGQCVRAVDVRGYALVSNDGGSSWSTHPSQNLDLVHLNARSLTFADPEHGWASGAMGICSTDDGGATWSTSKLPVEVGALDAVTSTDERHVWAAGGIVEQGGEYRPVVVASDDGGTTWAAQDVPGAGELSSIAFPDPDHGWAVGWNWGQDGLETFILAADEGGRNWSLQHGPTTDIGLIAVSFADAQHGWAVGTRHNGPRKKDDTGVILATDDGGRTWQAQAEVLSPLRCVACSDAQHVWAAGHEGFIVATDNSGATWNEQRSGATEPLTKISFSDSSHGWIVVERTGLLSTADGGKNWELVEPDGEAIIVDVAAVRGEPKE